MILIIAVFTKSFYQRIALAARHHTLLAFPISGGYVEYSKLTLLRDGPYLQKLQALTEPGTPILVWTASPFHLDFARNRLLPISEPGLINPVTAVPAGISAERLREYLQRVGIRYVWFQLPGAGIRTVEDMKMHLESSSSVERRLAEYGIYFRETFAALGQRCKVVYRDDAMLLFDLGDFRAKAVP